MYQTIRHVAIQLVFVLFLTLPVFGLNKPPFPVIFVHGLASSYHAWDDISLFLKSEGWEFGGFPTVEPTGAVPNLVAGDFYTMNFSDFEIPNFPSQHLSLDRQGWELSAIIQAVLVANLGKTKVILVAHSMGGLAARAYLQGLARVTDTSPRITYREDVAQLVTIGTPHDGARLAKTCRRTDYCLFAGIDPTSTAVVELTPKSEALRTLNDFRANPLPANVKYATFVGFNQDTDGDGIVSASSQGLLSKVPGLDHSLRNILVPDREDCGHDILGATFETHTCEPGDLAFRFESIREMRPVQWVAFLEGDPGIPGDGQVTTTTTFGALFELQPPLALAGTTTGITIRAFPPRGTKLKGYRVDANFSFLNKPTSDCSAGSPPEFEFTVTFNGVDGIASSIPQAWLNGLVDAVAQFFCPGVTLNDLFLNSVYLVRFSPTWEFIEQLDGLAVSR